MAYPTIGSLPPAPVRGDPPADFSTKANDWVAALPGWTVDVNAAGDYIEGKAAESEASALAAATAETNAETAEDGAVAAANYKGEWSSLSGPLAIPATVSHTGVVWLLKSSLADVTASQPSLVNTDWIALTQPVQTGSLALTSEFTLEGDSANVGDLMGLYSNGKVKVIKNHPGELAQNAVTSTFVNAILLSSTLGISVYRDESDGNKVKAQLYSIAGRKLTNIDTPVTIANTSATYIHADKIDANNIIIVYQDTSDSSQGKAIVINISGSTITTGSPAVFNAAVTTYCKVAVLTTTKAVVAYRDEGNSNYGVANTLAIAADVITPGTEVNWKTAAVLYIDVCRLTDTKAMVSYAGTSSYPEAVTLIINPGIVVGTNFTLQSNAVSSFFTTISRLTDTTTVASYCCNSLLYARHLTDSSGTITAGTEITIQANPSYLESCQLTSTRTLVTGRNASVSSYGYYWVIDNTSGTTLSNSSSAAFNSGTTTYTFPSRIQDNRVLIGYTDAGNSSYATAYVLDLSTETLKSIAGIVKEAGVECNTIDVVTQGECDFLSGLVAGSTYYSSATGALSGSIGDYEVGVAKSATNLLMYEDIEFTPPYVDNDKLAYIDSLYSSRASPNLARAMAYGMWTNREIKTSSGSFTVPEGVYYIGIACVGKGGNYGGSGFTCRSGAGGGGLSFSLKKVTPGEVISYTISGGIATCLTMTANPGGNSGGTNDANTVTPGGVGGTATGGDYNYSGGSGGIGRIASVGQYAYGAGGGAGGGTGGYCDSNGSTAPGPGGGGGRGFPDTTSFTPGKGGDATASNDYSHASGGSAVYAGGNVTAGSQYATGAGLSSPGGGSLSVVNSQNMIYAGKGINPFSLSRLGLCTTGECHIADSGWTISANMGDYANIPCPFGMASVSASQSSFGTSTSSRIFATSGFGGGGSAGQSGSGTPLAGALGGAGYNWATTSAPGIGGGVNGAGNDANGGAAVVIFIY